MIQLGRLKIPIDNLDHRKSLADIMTPTLMPEASELYMRLDFLSKFDYSLNNLDRPPLDVVFVLDISYSMNSQFPDDSDYRKKLCIAKESIQLMVSQLSDRDRAGLVTFNSSTETVSPLAYMNKSNTTKFISGLNSLNSNGSTDLALGLRAGFNEIRSNENDEIFRLKRVFFLTDMESTADDEAEVLLIAQQQVVITPPVDTTPERYPRECKKTKLSLSRESVIIFKYPVHISVIGIGIDLSVSTVQKLSAIPGAKYASVVNCKEFYSAIANEFNYDVMPIAFDIRLELSNGIAFKQFFGSAELNELTSGSSIANISSEFPVPVNADSKTCRGGVYMCELQLLDESNIKQCFNITVSWKDIYGRRRQQVIDFNIPNNTVSELSPTKAFSRSTRSSSTTFHSSMLDQGLLKAVALIYYVKLLTEYAFTVDPETSVVQLCDVATDSLVAQSSRCSPETLKLLHQLTSESLSGISIKSLPNDTPENFVMHYKRFHQFVQARQFLLDVMSVCGDNSLYGDNANVLETINQVINLESGDIREIVASTSPKFDKLHTGNAADSIPQGFICPINLAMMSDPVIAADGQSYERAAISKWLLSSDKSPLTGLKLSATTLIPNHALRSAIQERNFPIIFKLE